MFSEINQNAINVRFRTPNPRLLSIPDDQAALAAERLWKMTSWIHDEFLNDCQESRGVNWTRESDFTVRNVSRTLSYINHIYILEGVLQRMYKNMIGSLARYVTASVVPDGNAMTTRRSEVQTIYDFRNSVAAHTAYADPRSDRRDTVASEQTSLVTLLAPSLQGEDLATFTLGSLQVLADGQGPERSMPSVSIANLHPQMQAHFNSWRDMFLVQLRTAHNELPIHNEYQVERRRQDAS